MGRDGEYEMHGEMQGRVCMARCKIFKCKCYLITQANAIKRASARGRACLGGITGRARRDVHLGNRVGATGSRVPRCR